MEYMQTNLKAEFNFASFIVGKSNHRAYQTALKYAKQPGKSNNWLCINSDSGLGGTHLLHAIGNKLYEQQLNFSIKHINSERFATELATFQQKQKLSQFIANYSQLDCLLLDDITYLFGNTLTHSYAITTLTKILSRLGKAKKLVIFTANNAWCKQPCAYIQTVINHCHTVTIFQPDIALKKQLAKHFALKYGYKLSNELAAFISLQHAGNIRELESQIFCINLERESVQALLNIKFLKQFYLNWQQKFY